jgi:hypothetical protein
MPVLIPALDAIQEMVPMILTRALSFPLAAVVYLFIMSWPTAAQDAGKTDPPPAKSRLGMNLSGPADWSTEHPFVDVFRLSRQWISQRKGESWGKGPELTRDEHGWVKKLEPDCWAETPMLTAGHAPSGEYVCLYDGDGEVDIKGVKKVVSKEPGRLVVDVDGMKGGLFLSIRKTNPDNYIRNVRLIMPGQEKTCKDQPFNPAFLEKWKGFNTFRFMDWMHTNGSKVSKWSDRPTSQSNTWTDKGIPVEVMVELCNKLKVTPWFCMPHLADDEFVRSFAKVVKDKLDPSLKVYVEYSNEVWNSMFAQTKYAGDKGLELKFGEKHWEAGWRYSAYRSVQMFKIWEEVFGGKERLVRVMASQMNPYVSEQKLSFQEASKQCDALGIAPYIQGGLPAKGDEKRLGMDTIAGWTVDQLMDWFERDSLPKTLKGIQDQKKVADKYGLKLIAYEAGQHMVRVGGGENNQAATTLMHAANQHPRMGEVYTKYLDGWKEAGGDLMAIFASTGRWSKWGSWGISQYMEETEKDQPKLRAVMEWNRKNVRE